MSGSADLRRRERRDDGFTMIEIIVSLGVFAVVLVALLPQLIVGIKATGTARVVSQAKGVGQGQIEHLRHLPFHIAPAAGDYVDVLDKYFHDLGSGSSHTCTGAGGYVLPAGSWEGYVRATDARCDYEPATGAFYRTVESTTGDAGIRSFTVVTDVQFLTGATPPQPVAPAAGYDSSDDQHDSPPSSQIGVTVTVFYDRGGDVRPVTVHSQISQRLSAPERVRAAADARVLEIGSATSGGLPVTLQAGLVHLSGAVSYGSTARADLASVSGEIADGVPTSGYPKTGAHLATKAPPTVTTSLVDDPAQYLAADCVVACWGETQIPGFAIGAEGGRPTVGSAASPAQALVDGTTHQGISFDDGAATDYLTDLQLAPPLVTLDTTATSSSGSNGCITGSGTPSYLSAGGYLNTSDPEVSLDVESCVAGRSRAVELLPTADAPQGLIQIELRRASARCHVSGASHVGSTTYDYEAVVKYWDGDSYETAATVVPSQTTDDLATLPLDTTGVGEERVLGDYISSWSAVTPSEVLDETPSGAARLKIPGVVRILTQPLRPGTEAGVDPGSVLSLTVGAFECLAEDQR